MTKTDLISIIIPIHNGASWINQCFDSIIQQESFTDLNLEICICNDASTDNTLELLNNWKYVLNTYNVSFKIYNKTGIPGGVGYAKNRAIEVSSGTYLCFQDIDDVMLPKRIIRQYEKAIEMPNNVIIGSQFVRNPPNSTKRFAKWANSLTSNQLLVQIYTSHGSTIIMPTWFCHRSVFDRIGGFCENGKGTPEDLIFFYRHLDLGGGVVRIDQPLLIYTYHPSATTFSVDQLTILKIRLERLEKLVLSKWEKFTIWNAGKQGRKFYKSLSLTNRLKVKALCDVDKNKIGKQYVPYNLEFRCTETPIDIIHFKNAKPPIVICMKTDLTNGEFENNLKKLQLKENIDYIIFS